MGGVAPAHDRWVPVHKPVCGPVSRRGRADAIRAAERVGGRILKVCARTGISLPHHSGANRIVGIDLPDAAASSL